MLREKVEDTKKSAISKMFSIHSIGKTCNRPCKKDLRDLQKFMPYCYCSLFFRKRSCMILYVYIVIWQKKKKKKKTNKL